MTTFEITVRHASIPKDLDGHVAEKVSRLEKLLKGRAPRIEFILDKDHESFKCEMILHDTAGAVPPIVAHTTANAATVCIDLAVDKMRHQLIKLNERRHDHHRGDRTGALPGTAKPAGETDEPTYDQIVRREIKGNP